MKMIELEIERFEAVLSTYDKKQVMVFVPLVGTASLVFFGELRCQEDEEVDLQFVIHRNNVPRLVFYIKDVESIRGTNLQPVIKLKKAVDQAQVIE